MTEFPVSPQKAAELVRRMAALGISEDDLEEKFVQGGGKGGQKVNKTANGVFLKFIPANMEVKCHQYRSQGLNRYGARKILCEKLELQQGTGKKSAEIEKIRKRKERKKRRGKKQACIKKNPEE